jgi:hypothetical protein
MEFKYTIMNNDTPVELICKCDYSWSSDRGGEAYLESARINPARDSWNLVPLMTKEEREEVEEFYLDNLRAIEETHTHISLKRDNEL